MDELKFSREFDAQVGKPVEIAPGLTRVTAPNASAFTFTGTNSFLIGRKALFVVDPGPNSDTHLGALTAAIGDRPVKAILVSHTHKDHSGLAEKLKKATGAPLWFEGPHRTSRPKRWLEFNPIAASCDWNLVPDKRLSDREVIGVDGQEVEVVATPGHCANHIGFALKGTPYFLSGDHVMGWNTTLVAVPDGSMADYLASLDRLAGLDYAVFWPAHGGAVAEGPAFSRALRRHRDARNLQILGRLGAVPKSLARLTSEIYPGLTGRLGFAARMTLAAHLEFLAQHNKIGLWRTPLGSWAIKR